MKTTKKTTQLRIYRDGKICRIEPGVTVAMLEANGYFKRHPGAIVCKAKPSLKTLDKWAEDGVARAVDGCGYIEPDGHCEHGAPSWLLALGLI